MSDTSGPSARYDRPDRPPVETVLPPQPTIRRPLIVVFVPILVAISVLVSIPSLLQSLKHGKKVRHGLEQQLMKQSPDYSLDDVRVAVAIGVAVVLIFCIVFSLIELRASVRLLGKRRGARTALLWLAGFHLPLIAFAPQVRDIGRYDELAAWVQGICLAAAVGAAYWYTVGRWLTAVARQGPIPLQPSRRLPNG